MSLIQNQLQNMFDDVLEPMMGVRNQMGVGGRRGLDVFGNPLGQMGRGGFTDVNMDDNIMKFDQASLFTFHFTDFVLFDNVC
jgi:hypothetical protein